MCVLRISLGAGDWILCLPRLPGNSAPEIICRMAQRRERRTLSKLPRLNLSPPHRRTFDAGKRNLRAGAGSCGWPFLSWWASASIFFGRESRALESGGAPANRAKAGTGPAPIPVVAAKSRKGDIGVYFTGLGAVTPIYTVTVKSRVDGQLMSVNYKEGDLVHKGDLLLEIDPRPYEVQLTQAQGQLIKDQAALDNARIDLARYQTLAPQQAIPEQQLATQQATVTQDEGIVKTDQGLIDSANLNITYCHITAPITGRIGLRLVDPGNIVHAADTNGLLVITQIQPISVIFTIAEDQLPVVVKKMNAGQRLTVDAYSRDMNTKLASGTLTTLDNEIDPTTGTLKLRATFDNATTRCFRISS